MVGFMGRLNNAIMSILFLFLRIFVGRAEKIDVKIVGKYYGNRKSVPMCTHKSYLNNERKERN
jgi:hypothetical protein